MNTHKWLQEPFSRSVLGMCVCVSRLNRRDNELLDHICSVTASLSEKWERQNNRKRVFWGGALGKKTTFIFKRLLISHCPHVSASFCCTELLFQQGADGIKEEADKNWINCYESENRTQLLTELLFSDVLGKTELPTKMGGCITPHTLPPPSQTMGATKLPAETPAKKAKNSRTHHCAQNRKRVDTGKGHLWSSGRVKNKEKHLKGVNTWISSEGNWGKKLIWEN